jgi:colicin import membrane protein
MKKLFFTLLMLVPMTLWAQDNTWERPEVDEQAEAAKAKENPDAKYLKGAVPEVNGKVVFTKHINAPGKSAAQIYDILHQYLQKMVKEKNQLENSKLITEDTQKHELVASFEEWLVFKKSALVLDQTRFYYAIKAECKNGGVDVTMSHIRYLYEEQRNPQRLVAEGWITDKDAVNKKNTRLFPGSGKFRRKTIDRKDFLFNKFESLLNEN